MLKKVFLAPLNWKAAKDGEFEAVFSTLNVKDFDGDVTLIGAFGRQEVIIEPWNHGHTLPVGKGSIREEGGQAIVSGMFFLDTSTGRDHYLTVKQLPKTEWSYTFDVVKSRSGTFKGETVRFLEKLDVVGVGPVTRGAGIDTRTTAIKRNGTRLQSLRADISRLESDPLLVWAETRSLENFSLKSQLDALEADVQDQPIRLIDYYRDQMLQDGHSLAWVEIMLNSWVEQMRQHIANSSPFYEANPQIVRDQVRSYIMQPVRT